MQRSALGSVVVASLVGLVLAPSACSSGNGSLPSSVTNPSRDGGVIFLPPGVVLDAAADAADDATTPDASVADAEADAPSIDLECKNGKLDADETDVDCGGTACVRCAVGRRCTVDVDCKTGTCNAVDSACACPARMVTVPKATGGAYCIDETEVTKGDYDKFLRANVDVTKQDGTCKFVAPSTGNATFVPAGAWPPPQPLSTSYGLPVTHVDWCDAAAYCKWAGKVLCGDTSGAAVPTADYATAFTRADKDAWFNACSAQGANAYPYGATYVAGTAAIPQCNTSNSVPWLVADYADTGAYGSIPVDPTKPHFRSCQGGVVGLFHMSGNVAEWENSCDGTAATSSCRIRGGSFSSGASASCDAAASAARGTTAADIGIRCCQF